MRSLFTHFQILELLHHLIHPQDDLLTCKGMVVQLRQIQPSLFYGFHISQYTGLLRLPIEKPKV